jgi:glycosyltransferase involved in cell wall biosynthesis
MPVPLPKLIRVTTVPMALKHLLSGQMRYMKENGFEVIMVSAAGKEIDEVKANEDCRHHIINMTRKITPVADLKSLWQLYRFFKKEKPAIVHSHTPKAGLLAMIAAKLAGVKIRIHTVAGLRFVTSTGFTRKILVFMEKLTGRAATDVWPNSFSILKYVRDNKLVAEKKLQVIGLGSSNGINLNRFNALALQSSKEEELKKQLQYDENLAYLLSVGRIVKDKGIDELLVAFDKLYLQNTGLRLILLGSFEEELDPVSDNAKRILKEHPGIIHINWSDEVEYYMHLAHILIHPSYREGFPNVLLQAGAMGCPVVCSRIDGNIDIIDDKRTGLIFEAKNEIDLIEKLTFALGHRDLMKSCAVELQKKIITNFDQGLVHELIKKQYLELLSE